MADSLIGMLRRAGFRGEQLKTAWAIVKRESGGNPRAYNPDRSTGDDSYGLAQINMLGDLGPDRRRRYGLRSNADLYDPATNLRVMYEMSNRGSDFGAWGVGPKAYRKTAPLDFTGYPGDGGTDNMAAAAVSSARAARSASVPPDDGGGGRELALALLSRSSGRRRGGSPMSPILQALLTQRLTQPDEAAPARAAPTPRKGASAAAESAPGPTPTSSRGSSRDIREMFYDPAGYAYDEGSYIKPIGGHSNHVHVSFGTPQAALQSIQLARKLGLRAGENPYSDPVEPVHTKGSFHYRNFRGKYDGRTLGQALDVSGSAQSMSAYLKALGKRYGI